MEIQEHQISLPTCKNQKNTYDCCQQPTFITLMFIKDDVKIQSESRSSWWSHSYGNGLARISELTFNKSVQALVTLVACNDNIKTIYEIIAS